jgi:hypothetical protein
MPPISMPMLLKTMMARREAFVKLNKAVLDSSLSHNWMPHGRNIAAMKVKVMPPLLIPMFLKNLVVSSVILMELSKAVLNSSLSLIQMPHGMKVAATKVQMVALEVVTSAMKILVNRLALKKMVTRMCPP